MNVGKTAIHGTREVIARTGISKRQLNHWDATGFLRPSVAQADGRGSRRYYSEADVLKLEAAASLLGLGLQFQPQQDQTLADVLTALREHRTVLTFDIERALE